MPKFNEKVDNVINKAAQLLPGPLKPLPSGDDIARQRCIESGGEWDEASRTCKPAYVVQREKELAKQAAEQAKGTPPKATPAPGTIETFTNESGRSSGVVAPDGRTFLGLGPDDVNKFAEQQANIASRPTNSAPVGTAQNALNQAFEGQQLQGQVGQFNQQGISPTGLNFGEAATAGIVGAIPRALSLAATGAGIGLAGGAAVGGPAAPLTATGGAVIGAVAGFVGGIASSMISNLKSQRSDTTTAQQRVLDEGKQTMKDWATLAEADPANKATYLAEYNKVSAQIDAAYRQMKLDTSRDIAKFETALPNLAEFEAFYAPGGERDTLDVEMRNALLSPASPEYKLLELAERRKDINSQANI